MKIAIAGSSGLIGGALVAKLEHDGHEVIRFVRREATRANEISWDPTSQTPRPSDERRERQRPRLARPSLRSWLFQSEGQRRRLIPNRQHQ